MKVAYIRVSTDKTEQEESLQNQKTFYERLGIKKIYSDDGISATSINKREGFKSMLYDCGLDIKSVSRSNKLVVIPSERKSKISTIMTKSISRFARNVSEAIDIIKALSEKGVNVIFEQEHLDTSQVASQVLLNILLTLAESESVELSRRVRFGNEETAKRGVYRSASAFGYSYDKVSKTVTINTNEAEVVRLMFELRKQGKGCKLIAKELSKRGILTRRGKAWNVNTILQILKNPLYKGCIARNRFDCNSLRTHRKQIRTKAEEWIIHKDLSLQIVDEQLFDEVQRLIESAISCERNTGKLSLYAKKIVCGTCGSHYTRNTSRGQSYYLCYTKRKNSVKACNNPTIMQHRIDDAMKRFCGDGLYKHYHRQLEKLKKKVDAKKVELINSLNTKVDITPLLEQKELLQLKLDKLLELYLDGMFNKDVLNKKQSEIQASIDEINKQIASANAPSEEIDRQIEELDCLVAKAEREYEDIPKDLTLEELVEDYIKQIKVTKHGVLIVETNIDNYISQI